MSDAEERWLPVVGYNGFYEVSDYGRVRSVERWVRRGHGDVLFKSRVLRPGTKKSGYLCVTFSREGVHVTGLVHRVVLTAFVGPPPDGCVVCHFPDPDPSNNKLVNLAWGTTTENRRHMVIHGTLPRGEVHYRAKLTEAQVRDIKTRLKSGGGKRGTGKKLAEEFGVSRNTISQIKHGDSWTHIVV